MNDNSVPARIVIVGTSKMKLSDRFKSIPEQTSAPRAVTRSSALSNGVRMSSSGSRSVKQEPGRSFLFDDYMENDLYGNRPLHNGIDEGYEDDEDVIAEDHFDNVPSRSRSRPLNGGGARRVVTARAFDNGIRQQRMAPPRGFMRSNRAPQYVPRGRRYDTVPLDDFYADEIYQPLPRQSRPKMMPMRLPSIHERISVRRPPIRELIQNARNRFVRQPNNFGGGVRRGPMKKQPAGKFRSGFRARGGGRGGGNRRNAAPRKKPSPEELNADLDAYMQSKNAKHPRVAV